MLNVATKLEKQTLEVNCNLFLFFSLVTTIFYNEIWHHPGKCLI